MVLQRLRRWWRERVTLTPELLDMQAHALDDGRVGVDIDMESLEGYGFHTSGVLNLKQRDELFDVLLAARMKDERPGDVRLIRPAHRRRG
jgi:hypothetical protein